jgi:outer membrane immunogenic protein
MGRWVVGAEADASWTNFYGNAKCAIFGGPTSGTCNTKIDDLGSITGRLGYTTGKFLYYGNGGAAWARDEYGIKSFTVGPFNYTGTSTRWGWTLGKGVTYAMTPNWSVNAEYDYMDFGNHSVAMNDPVFGASNVSINQRLHIFKLGANYKFDWFR